jgi:hypothetical protein
LDLVSRTFCSPGLCSAVSSDPPNDPIKPTKGNSEVKKPAKKALEEAAPLKRKAVDTELKRQMMLINAAKASETVVRKQGSTVSLLRESKCGILDIGESHIERHHQTRERDHQRQWRQRNATIQKQSQAKYQISG